MQRARGLVDLSSHSSRIFIQICDFHEKSVTPRFELNCCVNVVHVCGRGWSSTTLWKTAPSQTSLSGMQPSSSWRKLCSPASETVRQVFKQDSTAVDKKVEVTTCTLVPFQMTSVPLKLIVFVLVKIQRNFTILCESWLLVYLVPSLF